MSHPDAGPRLPYPGLRPFEAEDKAVFFGRERQVASLLSRLDEHRFVAVVGSSGCGKSSLVRAGLIPAVRDGFLCGRKDWLVIVMKPGHEPHARLAAAIGQELGHSDLPTLTRMLRMADDGLYAVLRAIGVTQPVLIVVDQFEELFAFRRENARLDEVASRDDAAGFVDTLLYSCANTQMNVRVVPTMRSDFMGHCEAFLGLPEAVSESQFLVPRLDRDQMAEAICRPGEKQNNVSFDPFTVTADLVTRIINDAGDRPDQLPLMQHALMMTWKRAQQSGNPGTATELTCIEYDAVGCIDNALALDADSAWREISGQPKLPHIAQCLFVLLCDVSVDGKITRRRPRVSEIQAVAAASVEDVTAVLRVFNDHDRNFLPHETPLTPDSVVDVSHEALLRQWPLFTTKWLVQEREDAAELRRLVEQEGMEKQELLPRRTLQRVEEWRGRVSVQWAERYTSPDIWWRIMKFVDDSRRAVRRRTLWAWVVGVAIGISLAASTVLSYLQARAAKQARDGAEMALTTSYVRTIGVGTHLSADETDALWELSQQSVEAVRSDVLQRWFGGDRELLVRAISGGDRGLRAALGIDPRRWKRLLAGPALALIRDQAMHDVTPGLLMLMTSDDAVSILSQRLERMQRERAPLQPLLSTAQTTLAVSSQLDVPRGAALSNTAARSLLQAIDREIERGQINLICDAVLATMDLAEQLDDSQRTNMTTEVLQRVLKFLVFPLGRSGYFADRKELTHVLTRLAIHANEAETADFFLNLMSAMNGGAPTESYVYNSIELDALGTLAHVLNANDADRVAELACRELPRTTNDHSRLTWCKRLLPVFAAKMERTRAEALAEEILSEELIRLKRKEPHSSSLGYAWLEAWRLEQLAKILPWAPEGQVKSATVRSLVLRLVEAVRINRNSLIAGESNFPNIDAHVSSADAAHAINRLKIMLESDPPRPSNSDWVLNLLVLFGHHLDQGAADTFAEECLGMIERQHGRGPRAFNAAAALHGPIPNLSRKAADRDIERTAKIVADTNAEVEVREAALQLLPLFASDGAGRNVDKATSVLLESLQAAIDQIAKGPSPAKHLEEKSARAAEVTAPTTKHIEYTLAATASQALADRLQREPKVLQARLASDAAAKIATVLESADCATALDQCSRFTSALRDIAMLLDGSASARLSTSLVGYMKRMSQSSREQFTRSDRERIAELVVVIAHKIGSATTWEQASAALQMEIESIDRGEVRDVETLTRIGRQLAQFDPKEQDIHEIRLFALANMVMTPLSRRSSPSDDPGQEKDSLWSAVSELVAKLSRVELVEVLKWPFCVGEAERLVRTRLADLDHRDPRTVNIWEFVERDGLIHDVLIHDVAQPAQRPNIDLVERELQAVVAHPSRSP